MKFYFGKSNVQSARQEVNQTETIFESDNILIASKHPCMDLSLKDGRRVFLWGDIYGLKLQNGEYRPFDRDVSHSALCDVFAHLELPEVIGRLEGNYTAIILDITCDQACVFCDRFNRSEVFFTHKANGVVASSDLSAVIKVLDTIEYSQAALANLLSVYGYFAPKKMTIYKDVNRLGVGERLECGVDAITSAELPFQPAEYGSYSERENYEYADLFESAVKFRASGGINWVFLSSGWDSTSILSTLVQQYGASRVRCVVGKMNYSDRAGTINQFELDRAHKFAEYYGIKLDVVPLDLCDQGAVDYWKSICGSLREQHIYSFSAYNFFRMTEHVQNNGGDRDTIFAGEISDGIHNFGFSQSATVLEHPDLAFREYSDKMASYIYGPSFFKSVLENSFEDDAVYRFLRNRVGDSQFDEVSDSNEFERRKQYFLSFFNRNVRLPFYGANNSRILTSQGAEMLENEIYENYLKEAVEQSTQESLYSWLLHLYNSFHWQGGTVRCFGAKLSESGQKIKFPFWDGRLHKFLSEMPESWGRGLEMRPTKYPLKWALEHTQDYPMDYQSGPHSYLYDVNPQFSHIAELLFGSHLSVQYKEVLLGYPYEAILDKDHFDLAYLRTIVDKYQNGDEFGGQERTDLMALATLCLIGWY